METERRERVAVRIMLIAIALGLATLVAVELVLRVERVLVWMVIAVFFTTALYPAVDWVQGRARWVRRSLATLVVFVLVLVVLGGLLAVFAVPLARQGAALASQLPDMIAQARSGRGPVGDLLARTHALDLARQNQSRIQQFATGLGAPALNFLRGLATGIVAAITIFVLSYLAVLEGPKVVEGTLGLFSPARARRLRRVGRECASTVTGYITGNLIISVICGLLTYGVLKVFGVPFAGLIALFVGIADLIPLVGATLGAVVAGIAAFVHSVPAGIAVVVFFVLYQQVENHLLQPVVFARTVKLNPLTVLVAILLASELAGILGALLAIPVAGIIQVILRDIWANRRGPGPPSTVDGDAPAPAGDVHANDVPAGEVTASREPGTADR
ncbi:AI-2E family transporter [Actinophytocola sp.]|jgi:predicted PurR-regulated permease PerM|uniref:AI-2E family transporter n=1 Tax=Actinophytocola sp. TaxID=1872138 RepID=UPI002ED8F5FE